jgi:hypothetical protein
MENTVQYVVKPQFTNEAELEKFAEEGAKSFVKRLKAGEIKKDSPGNHGELFTRVEMNKHLDYLEKYVKSEAARPLMGRKADFIKESDNV